MHEKDSVGKKIDNYRIQSIMQTKVNGISIMRAINLTTNQMFVIKKAAISALPKQNTKNSGITEKSQETNSSQTESSLLYNQVSSIKQINVPRILKCLQMIKTKRSLYLVYENYPELNLQKYLKQRSPAPALKIRFAKIICEVVQEIHKKQYLYVNLNPTSIYVISGTNLNTSSYQLRFVDFQYSKKYKKPQCRVDTDIENQKNNLYLAPQVVVQGIASIQSDIYSVGKIFEFLGLTQAKSKSENKVSSQIIADMTHQDPKKRSPLSKVWEILKSKESQGRLFDHKVLQLHVNTNSIGARINEDAKTAISIEKSKVQPQKRNIQEQERRLRKILKIRNLVVYLHDLANFCLRQKSKQLFYLLFKKSVIVRANLIHELKKMLNLYSGQHYNKLHVLKQTLSQEQGKSLNLLTQVEQKLKSESNLNILQELENRNQLNQQLMQDQVIDFIAKKKKQVKPFHSILDQKQRNKLIHLCGLAQKLVYGSFQKFFDEVMDDNEAQLKRQKYFGYLKTASTKQIFDRLQKIAREKQKSKVI